MIQHNYKFLNSFQLKIIALITMVIDHLGTIFFPEEPWFRIVGRIAFVLYAFMIAEGVFHTHNFKKYISKLFLWAILSEIPFDYAFFGKIFNWESQNIFWTLLISVIPLSFFQKESKNPYRFFLLISAPFVADFLHFDYSWYGVMIIYAFYFLRNKSLYQNLTVGYLNLHFGLTTFFFQIFAFVGLIPIWFYNGKLGRKTGDWYYSFYAVHIAIFGIIKNQILNK